MRDINSFLLLDNIILLWTLWTFLWSVSETFNNSITSYWKIVSKVSCCIAVCVEFPLFLNLWTFRWKIKYKVSYMWQITQTVYNPWIYYLKYKKSCLQVLQVLQFHISSKYELVRSPVRRNGKLHHMNPPLARDSKKDQGTCHGALFINCTDLIHLYREPFVCTKEMFYLIVSMDEELFQFACMRLNFITH